MKKKTKKIRKDIFTDIKKVLKDDTSFGIKEAYNLVRAKLLFTTKGEDCPVYVVTSTLSEEGKSVNAANIAISFAMAGKKTLIIDADLRNPTLHKYLKKPVSPGLSEVLARIQKKINVVGTEQKNLFFLSAGEIPPNPAEILGSPVFGDTISQLTESFDYIFIDIPPIGIISDAAVIKDYVTGYILVVRAMKMNYAEVERTVDKMRSFNINLTGFLLNDVDKSEKKYSEYEYYKQ